MLREQMQQPNRLIKEQDYQLRKVLLSADLPENIALKADKGYQSQKNTALLKKLKLKNHVLKKAKKNKPLTRCWEKI